MAFPKLLWVKNLAVRGMLGRGLNFFEKASDEARLKMKN